MFDSSFIKERMEKYVNAIQAMMNYVALNKAEIDSQEILPLINIVRDQTDVIEIQKKDDEDCLTQEEKEKLIILLQSKKIILLKSRLELKKQENLIYQTLLFHCENMICLLGEAINSKEETGSIKKIFKNAWGPGLYSSRNKNNAPINETLKKTPSVYFVREEELSSGEEGDISSEDMSPDSMSSGESEKPKEKEKIFDEDFNSYGL